MDVTKLIILRHELILVLIILFLLVWKLFEKQEEKTHNKLLVINIILVINLIAGFLPISTGSLFSGMYQTVGIFILEKNLLNAGLLIVSLQAYEWLKNNKNMIEFYILLLTTLLGMFFMISSGNFLMFYMGLEMATIPVTILASFEREKIKSAEAGIKLILSSAFSSCILLFGISFIYATTGSIDFADVASFITGSNLQILGFIFIFAGFAFKISLVPFHLWTADVYEGAPVAITSWLSVISKGAMTFIFLTVLYTVFQNMIDTWNIVLLVTSVLTMTIGNLFAIRQTNLKRFLAFSSIAQAGYIMLGIIGSSVLGMASVVYFILIYIFSNLGAFGVVAAISNHAGKEDISDYRGLYKTNPKLSLLMLLALFSLAGIPPTAGFFGKFFLLTSVASQGFYVLLIIAALNMIISLYYYLLIVKAMFIDKNESPVVKFDSSFLTRSGLVICAAGILFTGVFSGFFEYIYLLAEKFVP